MINIVDKLWLSFNNRFIVLCRILILHIMLVLNRVNGDVFNVNGNSHLFISLESLTPTVHFGLRVVMNCAHDPARRPKFLCASVQFPSTSD